MFFYTLDERGDPIPCDVLTWAKWLETSGDQRVVKQTVIKPDVIVSTCFLGFDHHFGQGPPLLWETMVFGGRRNFFQQRYTSRRDALVGHAEIVKSCRAD